MVWLGHHTAGSRTGVWCPALGFGEPGPCVELPCGPGPVGVGGAEP